jgi:hypothetical protein
MAAAGKNVTGMYVKLGSNQLGIRISLEPDLFGMIRILARAMAV